jgi:phosphoribosylglycinamide formyltransferase-1
VANLAVLASGNGSNFEALAKGLDKDKHRLVCLISDKKDAFALKRAENLGVPAFFIPYKKGNAEETEKEMISLLKDRGAELIALAGFMRLLSPLFIDAFPSRIINIHPSLLPKYPGKFGIRESYESGNKNLGITIHYVDYGLDSGQIILQQSFWRNGTESMDEIESRIHALEHTYYPVIINRLLGELPLKGGEF